MTHPENRLFTPEYVRRLEERLGMREGVITFDAPDYKGLVFVPWEVLWETSGRSAPATSKAFVPELGHVTLVDMDLARGGW